MPACNQASKLSKVNSLVIDEGYFIARFLDRGLFLINYPAKPQKLNAGL